MDVSGYLSVYNKKKLISCKRARVNNENITDGNLLMDAFKKQITVVHLFYGVFFSVNDSTFTISGQI